MNCQSPTIIFDLDGTLYKTECVSLAAVHSAIRDFGLPEQQDGAVTALFGFSTPELCRHLFPNRRAQVVTALSDRVRLLLCQPAIEIATTG